MNTMNPLKTCRLCLRNLNNKGIDCTKITEIRDNILALFKITINTGDICKLICESCFENVMAFYAFKNTVQYCQTFIKDYVNVKKKVMDTLEDNETQFEQTINLSDDDNDDDNNELIPSLSSDTMLSALDNSQSEDGKLNTTPNIDSHIESIIAYMNGQNHNDVANTSRSTQTQHTDVLNEMNNIIRHELKKKVAFVNWKPHTNFSNNNNSSIYTESSFIASSSKSLPTTTNNHNNNNSARMDSTFFKQEISNGCLLELSNSNNNSKIEKPKLKDSVRQKLKNCKKCKVVCHNLTSNDIKKLKVNMNAPADNPVPIYHLPVPPAPLPPPKRKYANYSKRRTSSISSYDLNKVNNMSNYRALSSSPSTQINPCPKIIIARRKTLSISDLLTLRNCDKKIKKNKNNRTCTSRETDFKNMNQLKCNSSDSYFSNNIFQSKSGRSSFLNNCNLDPIATK